MEEQEMIGETAEVSKKVLYKKPKTASLCFALCGILALCGMAATGLYVHLEKSGQLEMSEYLQMLGANALGDILAFLGAAVCFGLLALAVYGDKRIPSALLSLGAAFFASGAICPHGVYDFWHVITDRGYAFSLFRGGLFDIAMFFVIFFLFSSFFWLVLLSKDEKGREGLSACKWIITLMLGCPVGLYVFGALLGLLLLFKSVEINGASFLLVGLKLLLVGAYLLAVYGFCKNADQKIESPLEALPEETQKNEEEEWV